MRRHRLPPDDPQLRAWLQALPPVSSPADLTDRTMDQVYEVARFKRRTHGPLRRAKRAGVLSLLLSMALLALWGGAIPGIQTTWVAEVPAATLLRNGLLASLVGVLLWQVDGLLLLRMRRR
jgi:hypothetical protein